MATGLRALQARILAGARMAPDPDAATLLVAGRPCGSLAPALADRLARDLAGLVHENGVLRIGDDDLDTAGRSERLQAVAARLLELGVVGAWRDENLDIRADPDGPALAWIDRSAVRVLGITTYSVHLNGYTADGQLVVAQRAAHKRVDPGMWDNLAGGMIASGESVHLALAREAFEEAGIDVTAMPLSAGARIGVRRRIAEGILAEVVHVFDVDLPAGTAVVNQDGEVARFETRSVAAVVAAIENAEFSTEAALATLESLLRRGHH